MAHIHEFVQEKNCTVKNKMLEPAVFFMEGYTAKSLDVEKGRVGFNPAAVDSAITYNTNRESNYIYKPLKLNFSSEYTHHTFRVLTLASLSS